MYLKLLKEWIRTQVNLEVMGARIFRESQLYELAAWLDTRLLTTDAPACGGGQDDTQSQDENDRPKANWKCPKCYLINAGDWQKCERCGEPSP